MMIQTLTENRRELVDAITAITGRKMQYQGVPTCSYSDGTFTVHKDKTLEVEDLDENMDVLKALVAQGMIDDSWDEDRPILSISFPTRLHTTTSLVHLLQIIWSKEGMINKAVGARSGFGISEKFIEQLREEPPTSVRGFLSFWNEHGGKDATWGMTFDEKKVTFTGFPYTEDAELVQAYTHLAAAINDEALIAKRVKLEQPDVENEKYFFRVWLVRIGLCGDEYKTTRKILLANLSGNSAFRTEEQRIRYMEKYGGRSDE